MPSACRRFTSSLISLAAAPASGPLAKLISGAKKLKGARPKGPKPVPLRATGVSITAVAPVALITPRRSTTPRYLPAAGHDRIHGAAITAESFLSTDESSAATGVNNASSWCPLSLPGTSLLLLSPIQFRS